jgi:hypothetical protein
MNEWDYRRDSEPGECVHCHAAIYYGAICAACSRQRNRLLEEPDLGRGWGVYEHVMCVLCGSAAHVVAPVGLKGYECSHCGHYDAEFEFRGLEGEIAGDGIALVPVRTVDQCDPR